MQNYFEIPEIKFNTKQLQEVYNNNVGEWASYGVYKNNSLHTQYVSLDNAVIKEMLNNFKDPFIIENVKFFKTLAGGEIHPHTDKRKVAINIPVVVDNTSYTLFYEPTNTFETPKINVGNKVQDVNAKKFTKGKIIEKVYLNAAICLNTNIPHGVINDGSNDRVILSISFKKEFDSFDIIKKLYDTRSLTRE